jgi:signal transduction histidine kinase
LKATSPELVPQYAAALQEYLAGGGEGVLRRAYELGRQALADGLGVLEMAVLLHRALRTVRPRGRTPEERAEMAAAMEEFFLECLSPFEMAHRGVQEANSALRRLNEMLEEVAKRIAHSLHDEAGQLLGSVYVALEELAWDLPPARRERLQKMRELLDETSEQLRRLSHELRPTILDDLGLLPAVEFLAEGVSKRTGLSITVEGSMEGRAGTSIETALYRIVQEALNNVTRHARATSVSVRFRREARQIRCSIRDDGVGFDVPRVVAGQDKQGLGLSEIRERVDALGGILEIASARGQGTELRLTIPCGDRAWRFGSF